LFAGLFKKHQYGTQTTIGTIEHLKNPSIQKVIDYFNTYYVPNNMAICLAGDFGPSTTIELIDNYFGKFERKEIPSFVMAAEDPIEQPIIKDVFSPEAENLLLAYRLDGVTKKDADMMEIISYILYNGTAGLIDLNLIQTQKVLSAYTYFWQNKDYSTLIFSGNPRSGQTLEEVKDLLLSQVEVFKKGDFPDWYLPAVINNLKVTKLNEIQDARYSIWGFVNTFVLGIPWEEYVNRIDRLSKITKEEIVEYANKNFKDNYVAVYKKTGEDKNVVKVIKPEITPVSVNRESESDFYKYISGIKASEIRPVYLDYKNDFKTLTLKNGIPIYYIQNKDNDLFSLYYVLEMGTNNDKKIGLAINYLQYLGTSKYSPAELKREFFKLGCTFGVNSSENQIYVYLSGIKENMSKGLELFEELLSDAKPNEPALKNMVSDILKNRSDDKLSKEKILFNAMQNYGFWGKFSPFTNILSVKELKELKPDELITMIKKINTFKHEIIYYGPETPEKVSENITQYHFSPDVLNPLSPKYNFSEQSTNENNVYVVNYDMKQAEIIMLSQGVKFDKEVVPIVRLFNTYAGDVVFQDLREAKALAYSVFATYQMPEEKDLSFYIYSYIGTQSDKLKEALEGMTGILNEMPMTDVAFNSAKDGVLEKIRTKRLIRADIIFNYLNNRKLGIDYDIRKDIYEKVNQYSLYDLKQFSNNYIKNKKYTILILGDKNKLDKKILDKYGKVKYLTLEEIFGY
ncbi:MAG: insulinase family protein, partial [Ignavibacteriae bacterium]|nr:insulinase family protein [Ignavibacteriota bacterium]